jgi:hypothetical protein
MYLQNCSLKIDVCDVRVLNLGAPADRCAYPASRLNEVLGSGGVARTHTVQGTSGHCVGARNKDITSLKIRFWVFQSTKMAYSETS